MSESIMGGRIFGDRIDEAERMCVIREVSGLRPWELAKWKAAKMAAGKVKK